MGPNQHPRGVIFLLKIVVSVAVLVAGAFAVWLYYPTLVGHTTRSATIYLSAPLALDSTTTTVNSAILALEEHSYRAGAVTVNLKVLEDGDSTGAWSEALERTNAEIAASDPNTIAYLGPINSGAAKVSMPILNRAGILQVSSANTWPGLTKSGFVPGEPGIFYPDGQRHYFRTATTDDLQGPAGARWASELGYRRVFVVNDSDSYGVGIAKLFEAEALRRGLVVVAHVSITSDQETITPVVEQIKNSQVDLVYYGGITPNGGPELLRLLHETSSTTIPFMGPDGIYEQDFIDRAGSDAAEGVYITSIGVPPQSIDTESAREYVRAYRDRFGSEPDVFGALTYDATNALLRAIERTGTLDRERTIRNFRSLGMQEGVFGSWRFDEYGDTSMVLMSGIRITNGLFEYSKSLQSE